MASGLPPDRRAERRTYDRLADLSVRIDSHTLEPLRGRVASGFVRHTTVVRLRGAGREGCGEDVTYEAVDQQRFQRQATALPRGEFTLETFSAALDAVELFSTPPARRASRDYRRWAVESAALDLALRQAATSLADRLGIVPRPVRFVVSPGLGQPASIAPLARLLDVDPELRFKLDATPAWDEALVRDLAEIDRVEVVDFKGAYRGTAVDRPADLALYRRVADRLARAILEDPALTPATRPFCERHRERISWDAPIHCVHDIEALPLPPRVLNMKPSRFGRLSSLFDAYDHCRAHGIDMYGGGQFELGPGRAQIQLLAALFHPSTCNDVAPGGYNVSPLSPDLPATPLLPAFDLPGFGRDGGSDPGRGSGA